jgi:hypothetical protein
MDRASDRTASDRSSRKGSAVLVNSINYRVEVLEAVRPVLVVCTHSGPEIDDQLRLLEDVARRFGRRLKLCLVEDDFLESAKRHFQVRGTPTYLMMHSGVERGRLLGIAEATVLNDFVSQHLL